MGNSKVNNGTYDSHVIDELIKNLEATTDQVHLLLEDIRDSEIEFATIKTELHIFVDNVKQLATLIQETDSGQSLLTRLALVENAIEELENWKNTEQSKLLSHEQPAIVAADKAGRWQLITAVATGILALLTSAITLIMNLLSAKH